MWSRREHFRWQGRTDEVTHGLAVIDGIFERFVGQSVPLLQGNRPAPFALDRLVADRACPPI